MMKIEVLTTLRELRAIRSEWEGLYERAQTRRIYLIYEWVFLTCEIYYEEKQLHIVLVKENDGQLIAIVPLAIKTAFFRGVNVRTIEFVHNDQNPANDFILRSGTEIEACTSIFKYLNTFKSWELVNLEKLDRLSDTSKIFNELSARNKFRFGVKENIKSPYITIDMCWDDFWNSKSQRFRKAIRNKINRSKKIEDLSIEKIQVSSRECQEVKEMFMVSSKSWKRQAGSDLLSKPKNSMFYKCLCDVLGPKGYIHIWMLRLKGDPIAFEFHIEHEGTVYPIRADYDECYKELSPGSILEFEIIKETFNGKKSLEYDSCGHTYKYLMNWTENVKDYHDIEIFGESIKMKTLHRIEYDLIPTIKKVIRNSA